MFHPLTLLDLTPHEATPFTLEHLLPELMGVASKWQSLGKALSLDKDLLDEIFTNNERDEACLQEMLEHYLMRSDMNHNWEEIDTALKRISQEETAAPTGILHVRSFTWGLLGYPVPAGTHSLSVDLTLATVCVLMPCKLYSKVMNLV